jgi:hypothetical protein
MPELQKPDMPAVLARTNLARHVGGFLLPIFEAVSNSIHSISERFPVDQVRTKGKIRIDVSDGDTSDKFSVTVTDNGVGLDPLNMKAFATPFTGNKLRKNGKGFGRFIAFKVFETVLYDFKATGTDQRRFRFDIYADEEIHFLKPRPEFPFETGCRVTYKDVRSEYIPRWQELTSEQFLDQITQNFLTYLAAGTMPDTIVSYAGAEVNLRDHFVSRFTYEERHEFTINMDGEECSFTLDVSRSEYGKPYERHTLLFFADNRILGKGRSIEGKVGRAFFERSDGSRYVVIAAVSGSFLDRHANTDRTFLEAPESQAVEIIDKACEYIEKTESDQQVIIKTEQRNNVVDLLQAHPLLRFGLSGKTVEQYVDKKPNNWRKENFVSDLSLQRLRAERRWTKYLQETFADEQKFRERKEELLAQVTDVYRDALAEYVVHRRAVLEVADALRKLDDTGSMHPEDAVHDLIFPRVSDSTETRYYRHNLWLLDERLSFVSYISSDRTLHGGRRKAGDKVIDIGFYDEVYVATGDGTTAVMVVEFKRPGRDDYRFGKDGRDPIKQIRDTVEHIRTRGSFVTQEGATIDVPDSTPITAYLIADLEPSLRDLAEYYDFQTSWDRKSMFDYHKKFKIYTEVFGYNKLLEDARKRNSPFFDVLLKDLGN